jgi:O-antigen ligase
MTKYLDSPLKITGILLSLTGLILSFFSFHPSIPEGLSIFLMGIVMLTTAWMITRSSMSRKDRNLVEITLLLIVILCSILMAMDYYGLIAIHHFLSSSGLREILTILPI